MEATSSLSNIQKELLKIYANNISDEQLFEIKLLLGRYFADKAKHLFDDFATQEGLTEQDYRNWTNEHNRSKNRS